MEETIKARCFLCTSRCGAKIIIHENKVFKVEGDEDDPVSRGWMCSAGKAAVAKMFLSGFYQFERFLHEEG